MAAKWRMHCRAKRGEKEIKEDATGVDREKISVTWTKEAAVKVEVSTCRLSLLNDILFLLQK